jgi:hypothetical protein
MHTTIRRYKIGKGTAAEVAEKVEDGLAPQLKEIDGFSGYFVLDIGNDEVVSISVFADKAGTDESTKAAADWVPDALAEHEPTAPEVVEGEVLLSVTP